MLCEILSQNKIAAQGNALGSFAFIAGEESPIVPKLFECYATGWYSMEQLEILFWEKDHRNHSGKKIAHTTMSEDSSAGGDCRYGRKEETEAADFQRPGGAAGQGIFEQSILIGSLPRWKITAPYICRS